MLTMKAQLVGNIALRHIKEVQDEWARALFKEGREIKKLYEKTTATWKHGVGFTIDTHVRGRVNWYAEVQSAGPNRRIYWFVHEGIDKMYAVLSSDWKGKTEPRVLGSGAGSGRVLFINPKVEQPKYPPREFTEKIIEVRQPQFQKAMEKATRDGVKNIP
jgi:hypothetical protein